MSHAAGAVRFPDGKVFFYEYDGTSDVCMPVLYRTYEEMVDHWRKDQDWTYCGCGKDEPVTLYSDYGGGWTWEGRACRHHMKITSTLEPYGDDESGEPIKHTDGKPGWAGKAEE